MVPLRRPVPGATVKVTVPDDVFHCGDVIVIQGSFDTADHMQPPDADTGTW